MSEVTLMQGCCLERMSEIPDGSVDMVLCDLPYGTTACKWDSVISLNQMWDGIGQLIGKNSCVVLFGTQPFTSSLVVSNQRMFKYELVFGKSLPVGHGYAKHRPMSNHENILVFSKGKTTYNPQMTPREKPRVYTRKNASLSGSSSMTSHDGATRTLMGKYPTTVRFFNTSVQASKVHPTQKPIALFSYLIKTYTNPGESVLDFCAGSGTTAVAAQETGRRWVMIEKEAEYCEIIAKRLEALQGR